MALASAAVLLLIALRLDWQVLMHSRSRLLLVLSTTLGFTLAARLAQGVNTSGALAGAAVAFVVANRNLLMFWILLIVFAVTLAATRAGAARKLTLQVAERKSGRSASQVMANLGIAMLILAIPTLSLAYVMALAAMAELTADTLSSEIGAGYSEKTFLITNWKAVPAGTDGGISLTGTAAGLLGAIIVAACAGASGLIQWHGSIVIASAGAAGMLADSMLGATLERRGYLNNDLVNLFGTASAAALAWVLQ